MVFKTMSEIRLIIAGTRDFHCYDIVKSEAASFVQELKEQSKGCTVTIVSGGARGADLLGERFAKEYGFKLMRFPADWKVYGKQAGPVRNRQMLNYAKEEQGALLAFWDGKSRGTKNMIDIAKDADIIIKIVPITT